MKLVSEQENKTMEEFSTEEAVKEAVENAEEMEAVDTDTAEAEATEENNIIISKKTDIFAIFE